MLCFLDLTYCSPLRYIDDLHYAGQDILTFPSITLICPLERHYGYSYCSMTSWAFGPSAKHIQKDSTCTAVVISPTSRSQHHKIHKPVDTELGDRVLYHFKLILPISEVCKNIYSYVVWSSWYHSAMKLKTVNTDLDTDIFILLFC